MANAREDLINGAMLYRTDISLLPQEVRDAIQNLQIVLTEYTDYLHIQLTLDGLRNKECEPDLMVIAPPLSDGTNDGS